MTIRNGTTARIVAYVAANPGCSRAQIIDGCDVVAMRGGSLLAYCRRIGLIHAAGPHSSQRYYPTADEAEAAHSVIVAEIEARKARRQRAKWAADNQRRLAERQARRPKVLAGIRERAEARRRARALLPKDVLIPVGVKVVVAPPMRDRWAA